MHPDDAAPQSLTSPPDQAGATAAPPQSGSHPLYRARALLGVLGTLALAGLGGGAAAAVHIPAGGIIGAVGSVGGGNLLTGRLPELSFRARRVALIFTGTVIGSGAGPQVVTSLRTFWLPALLMAFWVTAVGLALGWWFSRRSKLDPSTALFCFAPGGMSEMIMVAQEIGADARLVALVGLMRLLSTVVLVPLVLGYLVLRP